MAGSFPSPEQVLAQLAVMPRRIAALSAGVAPARLRMRPGTGEWSATDVLAHLRSCSDMWGGSIMRILAEDAPTFRAVNPTTWIKQTDYPDLEFEPSCRAYAAQRAELLSVLASLPPEGWSRAAMVTGAGKARQRTVLLYAEWLATHERQHIRQIERIVRDL